MGRKGEGLGGGIEEAEGPPHKAGSGGTVGNAVKAARLDENPHILEVQMGRGSIQEILQRDERTVFRSLMDDSLHDLLG